jgi:type III pantothenate kinase
MLAGFSRSGKLELPNDGIISSVVPNLTTVWEEALHVQLGQRPLVLGPGLKTGLKMHYNDPAEIGADRIADCVAAIKLHGFPVLVVDLGISTNIMVVGADGAFLGGLLAPGLALSAKALYASAARLAAVELKAPKHVIGKSTREAMQSGLVTGEVAMINGLVDAIWEELGYHTKVVITGSDASDLASMLKHQMIVEKDLTLCGLEIIYKLNRKPN